MDGPAPTSGVIVSAAWPAELPAELSDHYQHLWDYLGRSWPGMMDLELVGRGSQAVVVRARWTVLTFQLPGSSSVPGVLAIKVLPRQFGNDKHFAEGFLRQARALAQLDHPHIAPQVDFGVVQGICFQIVEFLHCNLRAVLAAPTFQADHADPASRVRFAVGLLIELCGALQHAHSRNIVHGDLKPENILFTEEGHAKLVDFGLALLADQHQLSTHWTRFRKAMGLSAYTAPEQVNDPHKADKRSDIYALGVIFQEILTGQPAPGGVDPPSAQVHDTRLDEVVDKATASDPERRYQSAERMRNDLQRLLGLPYPWSLLWDGFLICLWSVLPGMLVGSLVVRADLSTCLWFVLCWIGRVVFRSYSWWCSSRWRRTANILAYSACLGLALVGPLCGFRRPRAMRILDEVEFDLHILVVFTFGYSIYMGLLLGIRHGVLFSFLGSREGNGWLRGWLAFAAGVLVGVALAVGLVVQQDWELGLDRWMPLIVTGVLLAYMAVADHLQRSSVGHQLY